MLWKELQKSNSLYENTTNNDEMYLKTIGNPTSDKIVWFLNHWGKMRMHFDVDRISKCITESKDALATFKKYRIEIVDLTPLKDSILAVFQKFLESTGSAVATSKVLHVLVPQFFVMWDTAIRAGYGCGVTYDKSKVRNETYHVFLVRVQRELRKAIQSYADSHSIKDFELASDALKREPCFRHKRRSGTLDLITSHILISKLVS
jgi:hypothetical protein